MAYALKDFNGNWFRFWTIFGPCSTAEPAERALFSSVETAWDCSAMRTTVAYELVEVDDDAPGKLDWNK